MNRNVLVPVDGSNRSIDALEYAIQEHPDATITVFHVVNPSEFYKPPNYEGGSLVDYEHPDQVFEHYEDTAEDILTNTLEAVDADDMDIQTDFEVGDTAREIVKYIDNNGFDSVVIGSHGRTGLSRILLGSVAEAVTRRSAVPVTVVR